MDMNLFFGFFPFRLWLGTAHTVGILRLQLDRALNPKGSISGRTPLKRVLMSLSGFSPPLVGGKWISILFVDAGTHGTSTLLFAAVRCRLKQPFFFENFFYQFTQQMIQFSSNDQQSIIPVAYFLFSSYIKLAPLSID